MDLSLIFPGINKILVFTPKAFIANHLHGIISMVHNGVTYFVLLAAVLTGDFIFFVKSLEDLFFVFVFFHFFLIRVMILRP